MAAYFLHYQTSQRACDPVIPVVIPVVIQHHIVGTLPVKIYILETSTYRNGCEKVLVQLKMTSIPPAPADHSLLFSFSLGREESCPGLSGGAIAAIAIVVVGITAAAVVAVICIRRRMKRRDNQALDGTSMMKNKCLAFGILL